MSPFLRKFILYDQFGKELSLTDNSNIPVEVANIDGQAVDVQHPFPTNGDSVYCKDIDQGLSVVTDWVDADTTGEPVVCIPFTDLHTRIVNSTATNPKTLTVHFNRTVFATQVGLGCVSGDFSNVKLVLLGSGGTERTLVDESADNTKFTSKNYKFSKQLFNAVKFEFHTSDTVCLSNITIQKATNVSLSQVEQTTDSVKVIQYSHAELHSGDRFVTRSYSSIAKNASKLFLIVAPNTARWAHMQTGFDTSASPIVVNVYRTPTYSSIGTAVSVINRNGNMGTVNTTLIYEDPVITLNGTLMPVSYYLGSGKGNSGSARDSEELLLQQDTTYLVEVVEQNVTATILTWFFDWYEHTNAVS